MIRLGSHVYYFILSLCIPCEKYRLVGIFENFPESRFSKTYRIRFLKTYFHSEKKFPQTLTSTSETMTLRARVFMRVFTNVNLIFYIFYFEQKQQGNTLKTTCPKSHRSWGLNSQRAGPGIYDSQRAQIIAYFPTVSTQKKRYKRRVSYRFYSQKRYKRLSVRRW